MVGFAVFNELSLPFDTDIGIEKKFILFFKVLKELQSKNLTKIRMDEDFKNYEIIKNISLQQFFGQIENKTFQDRLREFIGNGIIKIETPLIKDEEIEKNIGGIENEYYYNGQSNFGGLACSDIWNSISISFNSNTEWNNDSITMTKNSLEIQIRHSSQVVHLNTHKVFFEEIEEELKQNITQNNFCDKRNEFFSHKIIFSKEIDKQIKDLDTSIFNQAIGILRDIDSGRKLVTDYNHSGESQSVKNDDTLKKLRYFTIDDEKVYFDNHIKSLSNGYRIYFLEKDGKIFIGYIGKHLKTKKFD